MNSLRNLRKSVAIFLLCIAAIATAIPYMWARWHTGVEWRAVTPELSYDAMFYYSRANDITRGHFFAHNPYFFEHKDESAPTPSLNDVLIGLPQVLGFSFNTGYYFNIFFWTLLLLAVIYILLRTFDVPIWISALGAVWSLIGVYVDMLRPGTMQIIYPLYIFFLVALWRFMTEEKSNSGTLLAIAGGIGAYFYIFLFMVTASSLGALALIALIRRSWNEFRRICVVGMGAAMVALPHYAYTYLLSTRDFYQETLVRISFFSSRIPQLDAYYNGRWIILVLFVVYLLRKYYPEMLSQRFHTFTWTTGVGLLLAMVSNIVIGQDFKIAFHIAKFSIIWYLVVGISIVLPLFELLQRSSVGLIKRIAVGALFMLLIVQMLANVPRATPTFSTMKEKFVEVQTYSGVLSWLTSQPPGVVLAPEDLNSYIPTLTEHYVLYNPYGAQFLASDDEIRERYLLYHAFDSLSLNEFIDPRGSFPFGHTPTDLAQASVLRHRICTAFRSEDACPSPRGAADFVDAKAMSRTYDTYYPGLPSRIVDEYVKHHVRYVVSRTDAPHPLLGGPNCPGVYKDEWFMACIFSPAPTASAR